MTVHSPFQPKRGANQIVSASGSSNSINVDAVSKSVRLVNVGDTNVCHFRVGKSPQTATTADTVLLPGESLIVEKGDGDDTVAYISASGTTLHIQPGEGGY